MKKLLLVVLAVAAIGATSCKKCKTCTQTITQNGVNVGSQSVGELCDDDLKDVDGKTITQTVPDGQGGTFTQEVKYTCN
jgi:hypothetical protein